MQTPSLSTVTIQQIDRLTPHVMHLTCTSSDPSFSFLAGQYGTVVIDQTTRRQYSFCSSPQHKHAFEFVIDTTPQGPGSLFFLSKHVGDTFQMLAPLGTFVLETSPKKSVFVATGTGIAPLRSMILDAVGTQDMTLYWGLRYETDIYWNEAFEALARKHPTFHYTLVLSKPEDTWSGNRGHVTEYLSRHTVATDADYYLSGNKDMIVDVKTLLLAQHVPEGQINTELF